MSFFQCMQTQRIRYRIDKNIIPTLAHATTWDKSIPRKVNGLCGKAYPWDDLHHRLNHSSRVADKVFCIVFRATTLLLRYHYLMSFSYLVLLICNVTLPDEHVFPTKEQPLPPVDLPTAMSPGYVADFDPEEDSKEDSEEEHADYPADGGDDDD
ncbi:hypothetical protein Tco_0740471, partial [Tanacetum coccineum]